jgi:tetratricopeptide (TPR) repeat protein
MAGRLPHGPRVGRILLESERAIHSSDEGGSSFRREQLRSAFAIDPEHVLTAWHCVRDSVERGEQLWFRLRADGPGEVYLPLKLVDFDRDFDVAVLVIDDHGLSAPGLSTDAARKLLAEAAIPLGVDAALHERVRIMGFPANVPGPDSHTLPAHIDDLMLPVGGITVMKLFGESFAAVDPIDPHGLSGGPVLKSRGPGGEEVAVGIVRGLPSGSYAGVAVGGGLIATRIEDVAGRFPQVADALLADVQGEIPLQRQAGTSLTALLRPDAGLVEFFGRDRELHDLRAWCQASADQAAWLVTGPGGQGKTRLALQLGSELRSTGTWAVMVLRGAGDPAFVDDLCRRAACAGRSLLLIADYAAEYGAAAFAELVTVLTSGPWPLRWRLLLLARSNGAWWEPQADGEPGPRLRSQLTGKGVEVPAAELALAPLVPDLPAREEAVGQIRAQLRPALEAFAAAHGLVLTSQPSVPDLSGTDLGSALMLHVAAVVSLLPVAGQPLYSADRPSASDLINRLLDLERERHWLYQDLATKRLYQPTQDAFGDLSHGDSAIVETAVAAATLAGAATPWAAIQMLARTLEVDPPRARSIARWLHDLYPPSSASPQTGWLPPLQPDLLGEELIARVIRRQLSEGTPSDRILPACVLGSGPDLLDDTQVYRLLTVIIRIGSRSQELADLMADAMRTRVSQGPGGLAEAVAWDSYCQAVIAQYGHAKEPGWSPVVLWMSDRVRECLAAEPESDRFRPEAAGIALGCETNYLRCYYAERSQEHLLIAAIEGLRELAERLPYGNEVKPKALTNLSCAYRSRHRSAFSHRTDLDDAVATGSQAVDLTDSRDYLYASRINNLGGSLYERHLRDGRISDLRQAIQNQQKLLDEDLVPADHRALLMSNLAEAMRDLFEIAGGRHALDKARQMHLEAVRLGRQTLNPDLALILCEAGVTARTWQTTLQGVAEAIALQQEAINLTNPGHAHWPHRMTSLAWSYRALAGISQGTAALAAASQAVTLFDKALTAIPETDPQWPMTVQGRAESNEQRWRQARDPKDLREALANYTEAIILAVRRSPVAVPAAAYSAGCLAADSGDLGAALAFFKHGLSAVDQLLASQVTNDDRNLILSQSSDLIHAAQVTYARSGQSEEATAILGKYAIP